MPSVAADLRQRLLPQPAGHAKASRPAMPDENAEWVVKHLLVAELALSALSSAGAASPAALAALEAALRPRLLAAPPDALATVAAQFAMAGHRLASDCMQAVVRRAVHHLQSAGRGPESATKEVRPKVTAQDQQDVALEGMRAGEGGPAGAAGDGEAVGAAPGEDAALQQAVLAAEAAFRQAVGESDDGTGSGSGSGGSASSGQSGRLGGFTLQSLATLAWALAAMGHEHAGAARGAASSSSSGSGRSSVRGDSSGSGSGAGAGSGAASLLAPLCAAALAAPDAEVSDLSAPKMLWTFGRLGYRPAEEALLLFAYHLKAQAGEMSGEDACDVVRQSRVF